MQVESSRRSVILLLLATPRLAKVYCIQKRWYNKPPKRVSSQNEQIVKTEAFEKTTSIDDDDEREAASVAGNVPYGSSSKKDHQSCWLRAQGTAGGRDRLRTHANPERLFLHKDIKVLDRLRMVSIWRVWLCLSGELVRHRFLGCCVQCFPHRWWPCSEPRETLPWRRDARFVDWSCA
ncbi:hypothetical protein BJ166DRAFT_302322 [Pestalotiopsis sp. NC0098]|nr:hypothetical protein BJ166DRAFT_302322 [Pestalotiopsis sp. NC0098]